MMDWTPWFAWYPVKSLYTLKTIWLVPAQRRKSSVTGNWMYLERKFKVSVHDRINLAA